MSDIIESESLFLSSFFLKNKCRTNSPLPYPNPDLINPNLIDKPKPNPSPNPSLAALHMVGVLLHYYSLLKLYSRLARRKISFLLLNPSLFLD